MTAVNAANTYAKLGLVPQQKKDNSGSLGQEDFLKLMIAQFRNQDPTDPMKNGKFLGQLAQFGTVSGIKKLEQSVSQLTGIIQSGRALRAATLVGRHVMVKGNKGVLDTGGSIAGAVALPASGQIKLTITNENGEQVDQMNLGLKPAGQVDFNWDGRKSDGTQAAPGVYVVHAQLVGAEGPKAVPTMIRSKINSVSLNQGQVSLAVEGLGNVSLSDVHEIGA